MSRAGQGAVSQRVMQAMPQPARTHAGRASVQQREQGGCGFATQGFRDFKIAPRGRIQPQIFAFALNGECRDMRQGLHLCGLRVAIQGAGRSQCQRFVRDAKAGQIARAKVFNEGMRCGLRVKMPVGKMLGDGGGLACQKRPGLLVVTQLIG